MSDIIIKTYELLDAIESSNMIKKMTIYKTRLLKNDNLLSLIKQYQNEKNIHEKIAIKKLILLDKDYQNYIESYNELALIVLKINNKYKEYTNTTNCN